MLTFPYQKIFSKKQDLNKFIIQLIDLIRYKKIKLPKRFDKSDYFSEEMFSDDSSDYYFIKAYVLEDSVFSLFPVFTEDTPSLRTNGSLYYFSGYDLISSDDKKNEIKNLESLDNINLQTTDQSKFLKNNFNIRISLGFKYSELQQLYKIITDKKIGYLGEVSNIPLNKEYLFTYINIGPYEKTWRMIIAKGTDNIEPYNVLCQDLISDYFQNKIYIPKLRFK